MVTIPVFKPNMAKCLSLPTGYAEGLRGTNFGGSPWGCLGCSRLNWVHRRQELSRTSQALVSMILGRQCCRVGGIPYQVLSDYRVQKRGSVLSGYPQTVTGNCVHPGSSQGFRGAAHEWKPATAESPHPTLHAPHDPCV